jgi:hypothetical protein
MKWGKKGAGFDAMQVRGPRPNPKKEAPCRANPRDKPWPRPTSNITIIIIAIMTPSYIVEVSD